MFLSIRVACRRWTPLHGSSPLGELDSESISVLVPCIPIKIQVKVVEYA